MPSYVYDLAMFLPHRTIIADTHEDINGYAINSRERMRNRRETSTRIQRTTTVKIIKRHWLKPIFIAVTYVDLHDIGRFIDII